MLVTAVVLVLVVVVVVAVVVAHGGNSHNGLKIETKAVTVAATVRQQ